MAFPVLSNGAWFLIKVECRRQRSAPSLTEARNQILGELNPAASQEVFARTRASVKVKDFGPTGMRDNRQ